jgi:general secretion pathway protein J
MSGKTRGFTLIEMLVALVLVALMSVAMLEAYRFSQRAMAQTTRVDAAVHDMAATQRLLRRILEQAYPFEAAAGMATAKTHGLEGAADGLVVTAPAPARAGGVGMYRYSLAVADNSLEMSWSTDRNGARDTNAGAEPRREVLLEGVESLSIDYLELVERGNGEIEPFWHETWLDKAQPPALVRIRVRFAAGEHRAWPELVVAPRISTDANCVFDVVSQMCRMAT